MKSRDFFRQTWVEVDLAALESNYRLIRRTLAPQTKIMAAVKANAYGHGMLEVSRRLVSYGVDYLGVACIDEALALRKGGIEAPLLDLGAFLKGDLEAIVRHDVTATVTDLRLARQLDDAARRLKKRIKVHIKVDTGMGRLGVWHKEADLFIRRVCALTHLKIEGLYTHFPSADSDEAFTKSQIAVFSALIDKLRLGGIEIPLRHSANSAAILAFEDSHFNLVRPGLALYGLRPEAKFPGRLVLKPVLAFKTRIAYLKEVARGRTISYGRTYTAKSPTTVATLPVGYGDGYNRLLSNKARVLIRGRLCRVVGVVCMDQTMVDVRPLRQQARIYDEVVLIGSQGARRIRAEEIASLCRTIPYEVVCWISPRVPRVYLDKDS